MWSIGLDVHQKSSTVCILNEDGKVVKQMKIRGRWSKMLTEFRDLKHPFAVCYEASCGYGYLHDQLQRIAQRVVVAHPAQLRLIFRSKRKNDRVDAKKPATLLFLDQVPSVYVPSVDVRGWRSLIEFRHRLIAKRVRVKNSLRSLLRGQGVELPSGQRMWTCKGLAFIRDVDLSPRPLALQRDIQLDELESIHQQIRRAEAELNAMGDAHPGVYWLRTIPGVGPRTAEAVVAYIDNARRFAHNKYVGSYFGLVPSQDQSSDRNRLGHITREGPSTVRKMLAEAAWQGIRHSRHIRNYYDRMLHGDEQRKRIALVATAHYLVRVMHAMLRSGEVWRFDQKEKQAA